MSSSTQSKSFMDIALEEARIAEKMGEVPIGAVIVRDGNIIARSGNRTRTAKDATAHAEALAIRMACEAIGQDRLTDCDLYVTLEPCTMCAGAISHARLRRVYFAAEDAKGGAVVSGVRFFSSQTCHHAPEVYDGLGAREASEMLRSFFDDKRL